MSRETTSNKSIWNGRRERERESDLVKVWGSYLAINIFSSGIESHSICTFSQLFGWAEIEGDPNVGKR